MRIVIVDDEPIICEGLANMLAAQKEEKWELIAVYHDTEEALETCNWENVDLLLLDINMPGMNGLEMVELLREREWDTLVIIISGYAQFEYARKAMLNNAVDFITKPVATDKLFAALHKAQAILNERDVERKNRLLIAENIDRLIREYFSEIIFGTQNFSDAQKQNICTEFDLGRKTYSIMILLMDEGYSDFTGLLDAAKKTFRCSFYSYPAGSGLAVILGILSESAHFDPNIFLNLAKEYIQNIKWFGSVSAETIDAINTSYTRLFQQMRDSGATNPTQMRGVVEQGSLLPAAKNTYSLPVLQVLEIIDRDYAQPLSLTILSGRVCVHPTYLSNLFKKQAGLTLVEYINRRRIEQAKKLLEDPLNKIFWISERVGFMNQRYFSQVFKRITGLTPVEYRSDFFLASGGAEVK
ncbi:MAG: hypothetical protein SAMD01599839_16780 [Rectinema sp.]